MVPWAAACATIEASSSMSVTRTGVAATQWSPSQWENTISSRDACHVTRRNLSDPSAWGTRTRCRSLFPLIPIAPTFVAGGPPVNLALTGDLVIGSELDAEFRAGKACRDVGSVRSGLEAAFGEPAGERHGEGSKLWSVTGGERVGGGGESVGRDGVSVGPVLPGDERFVSGFGVFGGWVVVVDLSSPGPEVPDVANEIAAFAVELGALLQDGAGLLGDVVEVVFGGGDVAFAAGRSWRALRRSRQPPSLMVRSS